jgi:hypothetical protein
MAAKDLSIESMLAISTGWIDAARDRKLLEAIPLCQPIVPLVEAAHHNLLAIRTAGDTSAADAELAALKDRAAAQDGRHDRKARGTYLVLSGLAEVAEDADLAAALLALRDRLLPRGLGTTTMSYADEVGHAQVVKKLLDAPTRAALEKVKTLGGRTLDDEVGAWVAAGEALATIEAERTRKERARDAAAVPSAGDALRARNAWIRAANALVSNLDLAGDVDDATRGRILDPFRQAEARSDRRGAGRRPGRPTPPPASEAEGGQAK